MGHGARGLLRERRRLGLVPARPRPLAGVPLERGRDGRHLRHPPRALPRARAVERRRPDPQGADVRPDRAAGQPRRGRQGVLVVPRGAAEPRAAAAGATTTRRPRSRTSSWSNHGRGLARPGARAARHRRVRRRPVLVGRRHLRQGVADRGADADRAREPRARRGDAPRAADAVVPQHLVVGRRRSPRRGSRATAAALVVAEHATSPATGSRRRRARTARRPRRSSARTRRTRRASSAPSATTPYPEGRHQRPRRLGRRDRQPRRGSARRRRSATS